MRRIVRAWSMALPPEAVACLAALERGDEVQPFDFTVRPEVRAIDVTMHVGDTRPGARIPVSVLQADLHDLPEGERAGEDALTAALTRTFAQRDARLEVLLTPPRALVRVWTTPDDPQSFPSTPDEVLMVELEPEGVGVSRSSQ